MTCSDTLTGRLARAAMMAAMLVLIATAVIAAPKSLQTMAAEHPWLPWPSEQIEGHPLEPVVEGVLTGEHGRQPAWKLPMLVNGLRKDIEQCTITAYCSECCDGGGTTTRWGSPVRRGICAADPDYWGPGSVIWVGPPVNEVLIVEDTGGAIQGPHRFDVCMEGAHYMCERIGISTTVYVPLHRVPPTFHWGEKPEGRHPPVWATPRDADEAE